jgi:hypothetical protein
MIKMLSLPNHHGNRVKGIHCFIVAPSDGLKGNINEWQATEVDHVRFENLPFSMDQFSMNPDPGYQTVRTQKNKQKKISVIINKKCPEKVAPWK